MLTGMTVPDDDLLANLQLDITDEGEAVDGPATAEDDIVVEGSDATAEEDDGVDTAEDPDGSSYGASAA